MTGPDVRRGVAGTISFQIRLNRPRWAYSNHESDRIIDVEVELAALERISGLSMEPGRISGTLAGTRTIVERAARRIIDREGPNFIEPVRVTTQDI